MATLWIREYATLARPPYQAGSDAGTPSDMPMEPGTDQTAVTFTTTTASAAFGANTRYIAIIADAAFHYVVAAAPTATTNALKVPANTLVHIGVIPGQKIAAVTAA